MSSSLLIFLYCVLVAAASLFGGWLPSFLKLTHTRLQLTMSLVAGLMLGVGLWHLLPHGVVEIQISHQGNALDLALWWLMIGLVTMFFLIRAFHIHHHSTGDEDDTAEEPRQKPIVAPQGLAIVETHVHGPSCNHDHAHHDHGHGHSHGDEDFVPKHPLAWVGLFFGLALHTLIDGLALGASVAGPHAGEEAGLMGLGTFLAIALHKPLDALSIQSLMRAGGWSPEWRAAVNLGFALMCPIGALIFFFGVDAKWFGGMDHLIVGCALAFSAGVFLCISLGDLLPELHFHSHDQAGLSFALLLGIALAYGIRFLEPEHAHGPPTKPAAHGKDHDHEHDH